MLSGRTRDTWNSALLPATYVQSQVASGPHAYVITALTINVLFGNKLTRLVCFVKCPDEVDSYENWSFQLHDKIVSRQHFAELPYSSFHRCSILLMLLLGHRERVRCLAQHDTNRTADVRNCAREPLPTRQVQHRRRGNIPTLTVPRFYSCVPSCGTARGSEHIFSVERLFWGDAGLF